MRDELSPSAAARLIGTTTRTVQRWIVTGRLPARRVGGRWRVAYDALDAFLVRDGTRGVSPVATLTHPPATRRTIERVFVANRGEIARRIRRTSERLGMVVIEPPTDGPDAVDLLDIDAVVAAARSAGAHALHPGFGFLAENAAFAAAVETAGIAWIGPPPSAIRAMGDKAAARRLAVELGVPIVPGEDGADQSDAALTRAAERIGYPLIVKP
ncbi:MAG: biotin carboxylase N-terminal domain-containing protein, partial [Candidatus Limnocylindrales bacterium]